jgi:4-amino-4-deoxy-L-arabinose transferase-like glycosyltransferase
VIHDNPLQAQPESEHDPAPAALHRLFLAVFALFAVAMLVLPLSHTLELWDESRNANNALEMAMRGHWIAPTYGWVTDHWNTKPPLLLWIVAALECAGVPPLIALRLPSELAGLGAVLAVYFFAREILGRPFAAIAAALTMMCSTLYFGLHMAMSGDYDALLCLFTTLYTLGFFIFAEGIEPYTTAAIGLAGASLACAVLTKSVAGGLLLPGMFVYLVLRGQLLRVLRDRRFWLAFGGALAVIALYYLGREHIDPGYLHAVWLNELGGRFAQANEGHHARTLFYANYLVHHFEPAMPLLLLGWFTFRRPRLTRHDGHSRAAALYTAVVALVFLLVLTIAKTKIFYYCAPAVPLLSLVAGLGLADALALLARIRRWSLARLQTGTFAVLTLLLAGFTVAGLRDAQAVTGGEQAQYGAVLDRMAGELERSGTPTPVLLLDPGFDTNANFHHYDPIADFYVKEFTRRGVNLRVEQPPAESLTRSSYPGGTWLLSCDPATVTRLTSLSGIHRVASPNLQPGFYDCAYGHF